MPRHTDLRLVAQDSEFRKYHDLMARKIRSILLVATAYDAWVMEEECRLSEGVVSEYRGLNLSEPPRLCWAAGPEEALRFLAVRQFDLVILMPQSGEQAGMDLGARIKGMRGDLPVYLLSHRETALQEAPLQGVDRHFVWTGNADLLVALVKSAEDAMNVEADTRSLGIRVIIVVEDSPRYLSGLLPILYRELVVQTQDVIREGLNQEHRLLCMRCRPKILCARTYEEAMTLFERHESDVLAVLSDVRFPRGGVLDSMAGIDLLREVRTRRMDIPLLLMSNETANARRAMGIPATFVDKNSSFLGSGVRRFVKNRLGFGDFVFRSPEGRELARAGTLYALEERLRTVSMDAIRHHARLNDFSRWFFARTEFDLASRLRPLSEEDFSSADALRQSMINMIRARREQRQKGIIVSLNATGFDPATDFYRIGNGSLGGKARGIGFLFMLLSRIPALQDKYPGVRFVAPKTLAIATEGFDSFLEMNGLRSLGGSGLSDDEILRQCLAGRLPNWVTYLLRVYLEHVRHPLAVRSSSLQEDAQFQAYAGLYATVMVPNTADSLDARLAAVEQAVKKVYASTFFQAPRAFARRVHHVADEEKMGVLIQQIVGERYGQWWYPAISGIAQSHNYYPFGRMKPEDGVASIAMGFGKTVVDGGRALRFSPRFPHILPQCPSVEQALRTAQTEFFCLPLAATEDPTASTGLVLRNVVEAGEDSPLPLLASTFLPEEGRIRDTAAIPDRPRVLLFAPVLKHKTLPLAEILYDVLGIAETAMGGPVELEFAANMYADKERKPEFSLLQMRPMAARADAVRVTITEEDRRQAVCLSAHALGNAQKENVRDVVYVRPETFAVEKTPQIAREVAQMNAALVREGRKYVLVGPGRWGTADRWLGIPVTWNDICGVEAIVETVADQLRVESSQGSHFFYNITTLGINYIMVSGRDQDRFSWDWLLAQPVEAGSDHVAHARLADPLVIKVDGRSSECAFIPGAPSMR